MTYEYVCTSCGHEWEADQSIKDPALKQCPECLAETAKRQVSGGTGFVLKGGGWYADLYGSAKPKSSSSDDSAKDSKSESKSSKTESKGESSSTESKPSATSSTAASSGSTSKTAD